MIGDDHLFLFKIGERIRIINVKGHLHQLRKPNHLIGIEATVRKRIQHHHDNDCHYLLSYDSSDLNSDFKNYFFHEMNLSSDVCMTSQEIVSKVFNIPD